MHTLRLASRRPVQSDKFSGAPRKWRKYLLLSMFGLTSEQQLNKSIKRFAFADLDTCRRSLRDALEKSKTTTMAVVKLVPMQESGRLPNYIVRKAVDIQEAFSLIQKRSHENWVEIWYCLNDVSVEKFSVGGRFIPDPIQHAAIQTLEQVWHTSPRLIEQLSEGVSFPYIRSERVGFEQRLTITAMFIPPGYPIDEARIRGEYLAVLKFIGDTKEAWETFVAYLSGKGVRAISLEYKVDNGEFSFIDWDSDDDARVI